MAELTVRTREAAPFTVVEVEGDLDLVSVGTLRSALEGLFRERRSHLVLDLRGVPFLDSTGLGVLVAAQRAVKPHGGEVRIVCADEHILRVLSITGLDQVVAIHPTLEAALAGDAPA